MKKLLSVIIMVLLLTGCTSEEPGNSLSLSAAPTVPMQDTEYFPLISHSSNGAKASGTAQNLSAEGGMFLLQETELDGSYYLLFYQDYFSHEVYPLQF